MQWNTYNTRYAKMIDAISAQKLQHSIMPNGNSPSGFLDIWLKLTIKS